MVTNKTSCDYKLLIERVSKAQQRIKAAVMARDDISQLNNDVLPQAVILLYIHCVTLLIVIILLYTCTLESGLTIVFQYFIIREDKSAILNAPNH